MTEACRVARPGGRVAVCKYGRPVDNDFFAFLIALGGHSATLETLPANDAVDRAIEGLQLTVVASGEIPAVMPLPGDEALAAALVAAGALVGGDGPAAWRRRVAAAASAYRRPDGSYRFENRLKYRIVAT